jgi:hypothetical protein
MSTLIDAPSSQEKEQWLKFLCEPIPEQGNHVVVVSGYANYDTLKGSEDEDNEDVEYLLWIPAGPRWRDLNDVSPTAFIAGYVHYSSDEADNTGMSVVNCTWEFPDTPERRIRLIVNVTIRGGDDAYLRKLGYHFTARGSLMPGQNFEEIVS